MNQLYICLYPLFVTTEPRVGFPLLISRFSLVIYFIRSSICMGFPGSSAGKESACNTGDPGLIPGSGRSAREGIGYPLQYSWASLVAQLVKNPPTMWEPWVGKIPWRREWLPLQYSCLENPLDCIVHGVTKSQT